MNVYRCYDENGALLYVGMTLCALKRIRQHRTKASWFKEIRTVTVEPHKSKKRAMMAEALAILLEEPKYNRVVPVLYFTKKEIAQAEEALKIKRNETQGENDLQVSSA